MKMNYLSDCTSISFTYSTCLKVYHYKREKQHQSSKDIVKKYYGTMDRILTLNSISSAMTKEKSLILCLVQPMSTAELN